MSTADSSAVATTGMKRNRAIRSRATSEDQPPITAYTSAEEDRAKVVSVIEKLALRCAGRGEESCQYKADATDEQPGRQCDQSTVGSIEFSGFDKLVGYKCRPGSQEREPVKKCQLLGIARWINAQERGGGDGQDRHERSGPEHRRRKLGGSDPATGQWGRLWRRSRNPPRSLFQGRACIGGIADGPVGRRAAA